MFEIDLVSGNASVRIPENDVVGLVSSPDGSRLAAINGNALFLYRAESGQLVETILLPDESWFEQDSAGGRRAAMAWSPDGKSIVLASKRRILFINAQTGSFQRSVPVLGRPTEISYSSDGKFMLAVGGKAPTLVLDVRSEPTVVKTLPNYTVGKLMDGELAVVGTSYKDFKLISILSGEILRTYTNDQAANYLSVASDGRSFVAAGENFLQSFKIERPTRVWSRQYDEYARNLFQLPNGTVALWLQGGVQLIDGSNGAVLRSLQIRDMPTLRNAAYQKATNEFIVSSVYSQVGRVHLPD